MTRAHIISVLKNADDYVSGEDISRTLKISRSAVWKVIRELRSDGYDIEAVTRRGYRMLKSPDRLFPDEISSRLTTKSLGRSVMYFDEIPSTMDTAMDLAMAESPEGAMVIAETQSKGKGRLGRSWVSPKGGGLYFSVILRPKLSVRDVPLMTLMSAVAVCQTIREVTSLPAKIKWPNDILIDGRKISGILMELNADMDRVKFVILGIGLNVNAARKALPDHATSLKVETGRAYVRADVLKILLKNIEEWYAVLEAQGAMRVLDQWRAWSETIGRRVKIEDQQGGCEGEALDIDEFGRLMVKDKSGKVLHRMTGDVIHLR